MKKLKKISLLIVYAFLFVLSYSLFFSCKKDEIKDTDNNNNNGLNDNFENCGIVTDGTGNTYNTIIIGQQCWIKENLRATQFNDGSPIPNVQNSSDWASLDVFTGGGALGAPAYSWYNNDVSNASVYGALYNYPAVATQKLCPDGWRVAGEYDWNQLIEYLFDNGYNFLSGIPTYKVAKSLAAKTNWETSTHVGAVGNNLSSNNRTGFSALPGGMRRTDGSFANIGACGYWWLPIGGAGTAAPYRFMTHKNNSVFMSANESKRLGLSIRCIKN